MHGWTTLFIEKIHTNAGIYTFVAVDEFNKPVPVPELEPETAEEIERYKAALRRKELSNLIRKNEAYRICRAEKLLQERFKSSK